MREVGLGVVVCHSPYKSTSMARGSIPALDAICGLRSLVLFSALRGFPLGILVFPSSQKPIFDIGFACFDLLLICRGFYIESLAWKTGQLLPTSSTLNKVTLPLLLLLLYTSYGRCSSASPGLDRLPMTHHRINISHGTR